MREKQSVDAKKEKEKKIDETISEGLDYLACADQAVFPFYHVFLFPFNLSPVLLLPLFFSGLALHVGAYVNPLAINFLGRAAHVDGSDFFSSSIPFTSTQVCNQLKFLLFPFDAKRRNYW